MSERLWTPSFVGLSFAGFFNSMIFYLLVPAMAGHAVDTFGAAPVEAGALPVAGTTAIGAVDLAGVRTGDRVLVRGGAGGVRRRFAAAPNRPPASLPSPAEGHEYSKRTHL